ncbi:RING-type E3 ubiquitin transferase [Plasmodiophora brassicae]
MSTDHVDVGADPGHLSRPAFIFLVQFVFVHGGPTDDDDELSRKTDVKAIEALEEIEVQTDDTSCVVCREAFCIEATATKLPCQHIFHKGCIVPWLEMRNTCPTCRYQLPLAEPVPS